MSSSSRSSAAGPGSGLAGGYTYYDVLGVEPSSSAQAIKRAFRKLVLKHHPDTQGRSGPPVRASRRFTFVEINDAYSVLKDATLRAEYDRTLQGQHATAATSRGARAASQTASKYATWERANGPSAQDFARQFEEWERGHGLGRYAKRPPTQGRPTFGGRPAQNLNKHQQYFQRQLKRAGGRRSASTVAACVGMLHIPASALLQQALAFDR